MLRLAERREEAANELQKALDLYEQKGTVSYGGPSPGVNNPVRYAWWEQSAGMRGLARTEGGAHDFMAPARALGDEYQDVVEDTMDGSL